MRKLHDNTIYEIAKFICGYNKKIYPINRDSNSLIEYFIDLSTPPMNPLVKPTIKNLLYSYYKNLFNNQDNTTAVYDSILNHPNLLENLIFKLVDPRFYRKKIKLQNLALETMNKILIDENYKIELSDGLPKLIDINDKLKLEENIMETPKIKIFISHSSKDEKEMNLLIEFLQASINYISDDEIRCTSVEGYGYRTGEDFLALIKKETSTSSILLCAFSENTFDSSMVLFECGIGWYLEKTFPIILNKKIEYKNLPMPYQSNIAKRVYLENEVIALIGDIAKKLKLDLNRPEKVNEKAKLFIKNYNAIIKDKMDIIEIMPEKNEFENEWEVDKIKFEKNLNLVNNFNLLFEDSTGNNWLNFNSYKNYLPIFLSMQLYEDCREYPLITQKGQFYFLKLYPNRSQIQVHKNYEYNQIKELLINDKISFKYRVQKDDTFFVSYSHHEMNSSVLELFIDFQDEFIRSVHSNFETNTLKDYLYRKVAPKLCLFHLLEHKIVQGKHDFFELTEYGKDFIKFCNKEIRNTNDK